MVHAVQDLAHERHPSAQRLKLRDRERAQLGRPLLARLVPNVAHSRIQSLEFDFFRSPVVDESALADVTHEPCVEVPLWMVVTWARLLASTGQTANERSILTGSRLVH